MVNHVKNILRSLTTKFISKVTTIREAKDLNKLSFESLIRNLQSHEMKLNGVEPVVKSKTLALKSMARICGGKIVKSSKVQKLEETSNGDSDEEEIVIIIRRLQKLSRKNRRLSCKSNGFIWFSSKDNIGNHKNYFNCKKPRHFIDDFLDLHKEISKKGGFQKDIFISKLKKSPMATWDELDNEDESDKNE